MNDIEYLNTCVLATLKPSKRGGVGVFAIQTIPRGTLITDHSVHQPGFKKCRVQAEDFHLVHPAVRALILDRTTFHADRDTFIFMSPNCEQTLQSFMNHSDEPNTDGSRTLRDVAAGEELTEDYRALAHEMHPLTRAHYTFL